MHWPVSMQEGKGTTNSRRPGRLSWVVGCVGVET